MYVFLTLFKYLMSSYYKPVTVSGSWDSSVNKIDISAFYEVYILVMGNKITN